MMYAHFTHKELDTELYVSQERCHWPKKGAHILAQYDDESIVVYQAFNHKIANYAVKHQMFGGPDYSFDRMSWIKTNFLWMMYRCGWASKENQTSVLAIRITRDGFEEILRSAFTAQRQSLLGLTKNDIQVRLQWDPDHKPSYEKCERRAIQLGMKGDILKEFGTKWIISIEDITPFVKEQSGNVKNLDALLVPKERVYKITDPIIVENIGLSSFQDEDVH